MEVKSTPPPPLNAGVPPLDLDEEALEVSERARRFAEEVLMPLEEEAERRGGRLPDDVVADLRRRAVDARLQGGMHAAGHGGAGGGRGPRGTGGGGEWGPGHPPPPPRPPP